MSSVRPWYSMAPSVRIRPMSPVRNQSPRKAQVPRQIAQRQAGVAGVNRDLARLAALNRIVTVQYCHRAPGLGVAECARMVRGGLAIPI